MAKNKKRLDFFRKRLPLYRKDPVLFCREVTHFEPEYYQEELLMKLASSPKTSIKSGHGIGKTATEANAVLWFLSCFPYARVVATAPTSQQLHDVLWAEINKWIARSPLLQDILHWTKTYVYVDGYERRWFAVAKTAAKPENMQGFHEDNMLFIVDEASGVEDEIMEAILATLSGGNNKLLMCGNPTRTSGTFYDSFHKDRALYKTMTVSSLDSRRTNKENIAMFRRKYGEHSNIYKVRVLGEFPTQEDDVFIPLPLIEKTVMTELQDSAVNSIIIGVDVARYGDDETVIATNIGGNCSLPIVEHGQSLMKTVGDIVVLYRKLIRQYQKYRGPITVNIDDTGLGGGVTDRLEEVKREQKLSRMEIVPINFAMKPPQDGSEEHYDDITTYMWANIKTLMENGEIHIEDDEELVAQLSVRKYSISSGGRIVLESKKAMKDRGIKSPDRGDALALACFKQKKVYQSYVDNSELVILSPSAVAQMNIMKLNLGISIGNSYQGASFVATAITENHSKVIVLASESYEGEIETEKLGDEFTAFARRILDEYHRLDYAYCDAKESFLFRCIKNACEKNFLPIRVRRDAGVDEANRIRLTTRLLTQNRLFVTEDCIELMSAFSTAVWNERKSADGRSDNSDNVTLNAFEYTIERDSTKFVKFEPKKEA